MENLTVVQGPGDTGDKMKITKRQLRRIIRENRSQEILKLISDRISDVGFGDEDEEDFESVKIELGEDGLASQEELDQLTFDQWKELKESKAMKITKGQLRRIIKEEVRSLHRSRISANPEEELKAWISVVGAHNIERALSGKKDLIYELIKALQDFEAQR